MTKTPLAPHVYPALDTLRALASIAVVVTHVAFWTGTYTAGFWGTISARMDVGVAIFFVLSGFLVGKPFLQALATRAARPQTATYLWRRGLRILPVYWVCVAGALFLVQDNATGDLTVWRQNVLLTRLYEEHLLTPGLTQMWSLSTEVAFYVVLPAVMWALGSTLFRQRWRPRLLLALLGCASVLSWTWVAVAASDRAEALNGPGQWLLAYGSWFAIGLVFALAVVEGWSLPRSLFAGPWTAWGCAAALLVAAATPIAGPTMLVPTEPVEAVTKNVLYALVAGLLVGPAIFAPTSTAFFRVMSSPGLRHIGHISYSLFCCHLIVIHVTYDLLDVEPFQGRFVPMFALILSISLVVSEILYRLVERPSMRLRNLFVKGPKTQAPATPTEPAAIA